MAFFQFIDPVNTMTGQIAIATADEISTTNSTDFLEKLRLTTTGLLAGEYRVVWAYSWNTSSTKRYFEARVQLNDSIDLGTHREEPQDIRGDLASTGSGQVLRSSGIATRTLSGTVNIDLDWRTEAITATASIWDARLELWRIS